MKKIILFTAISCILYSLNLSAQKVSDAPVFNSATEYNDYIIGQQQKVGDYMTLLSMAVENGTKQEMQDALDSLKSHTKESLKLIKQLGIYNNNSEFRDAALKLFTFYNKISKKEFRIMVKILKKGSNITKKDFKTLSDLDNKISERENVLDKSFGEAQQKFAKENNFTIGE